MMRSASAVLCGLTTTLRPYKTIAEHVAYGPRPQEIDRETIVKSQ